MGWFSKTVPEGKFLDVATVIARELNAHCDPWFIALRSDPESTAISWRSDTLTGDARNYANMLQMSAVASAFADGKYFRSPENAMLVQELIYTLLTGHPPETFHANVEELLPCADPDPGESIRRWASAMAPLYSSDEFPRTAKQLQKWLPLIVCKAMIATCKGCGDERSAKKLSAMWQ